MDAFEADQALFQYSRAAKGLWKFCNGADVEWVARDIRDAGTEPVVGARSTSATLIERARASPAANAAHGCCRGKNAVLSLVSQLGSRCEDDYVRERLGPDPTAARI